MSHHMIAHAIQHKTYPRTRTRLGVTRVQHPIRDIESQRYDQCVVPLVDACAKCSYKYTYTRSHLLAYKS